MSDNIIFLNGKPVEPGEADIDPNVVKTLEGALERARSGEIVAVAIATIMANGSGGTSFAGAARPIELLGAIGILRARLEQSLIDFAED